MFRIELEQLVAAEHPLVKLGRELDWALFEERLGATYAVVQHWVENPYEVGTIRLVCALQPSQIEILAHDESEYCSWRTGAIKIRLAQDDYTVMAITLVLAVESGKRRRKIRGALEDFFETGTEGVIWSVVSEDDHGYDALYPIEEG